MSEIAIKVSKVKKDFHLPHEKNSSIKSAIVGVFRKKDKNYDTQHALKDISFDIPKGEFFGILGRNGSGKSTLLKILAEIYQPTKGTIKTNGKLVPFIELGVGFNPELTGRENVYLNGALLGFSRKEIDARYDEIVEFAELEDFMDQKLKNYSSGMQVRLAFSVATRAEADILLVDEVLAVGDADFQRKCYDYFKSLKKTGKTVIFVTHDMSAVREYCDRAILIEKGIITHQGKASMVADEYLKLFMNKGSEFVLNEPNRWGNGEAVFDNINQEFNEKVITLDFDVVNRTEHDFIDALQIGVDFYADGNLIGGNNTKYTDEFKKGVSVAAGEREHFTINFENILGNLNYTVNMNIKTASGSVVCDEITDAFAIESPNGQYARFFPIVIPSTFKKSNSSGSISKSALRLDK